MKTKVITIDFTEKNILYSACWLAVDVATFTALQQNQMIHVRNVLAHNHKIKMNKTKTEKNVCKKKKQQQHTNQPCKFMHIVFMGPNDVNENMNVRCNRT